jgi:hypothetical protein
MAMRSSSGLHESEQDLANEKRIAEAFAKHSNGIPKKMPKAYPFDYMIIRGDKCAFIDARKAGNEIARFPTRCLSLQKYIALKLYAAFAPMFYVIEWADAIAYYEIKEDSSLPVFFMSRDSGDPRDNEPCVEIPIADFKRF